MSGAVCWGSATVERSLGGVPVRVFTPRPGSLPELVTDAAAYGDRDYLVDGQRRLGFAAFATAVQAAGSWLQMIGVRSGERVLLVGPNSIEWVVSFFAVMSAGAQAVLANPWWTQGDFDHAIHVTEATLALVDGPAAGHLPPGTRTASLPAVEEGTAEPALPLVPIDEDDGAVVVFTSGTAADPKATLLSHRACIANVHSLLVRAGRLPSPETPGRQPVSLFSLPLFHIGGVQTIIQALVSGGRLVFTPGRFDAGDTLRIIASERPQFWTAVPTMVAKVLDHEAFADHDTSSLVSIGLGGAPVPARLVTRTKTAFPNLRDRVAQGYGATEAGGTIASAATSPDSDGRPIAMQPVPTVELRIADPDERGTGEILVRSPMVMDGYLGVPGEEQPIDADGWLHTGDTGALTADGLLITGRMKDVIIRGGENIAASYVEEALRTHPEVRDAAVIGLDDPVMGQEVAAAVLAEPGHEPDAAALTSFLTGRITPFAIPTRWWFVTEPFPTTDTGKVRKRDIADGFPPPLPLPVPATSAWR